MNRTGVSQIFDVFLNTKDQRIIEIADYLFEHQTSSVLLKKVAKKLKLTSTIVRESLQEYSQMDLEKCGFILVKITKDEVRYSMNNYSSNLLRQLLIRDSHLFLLCEQIFYKKFENIVVFSVETYTSVSTIYRKLPQLKKLLKNYRLELDLTNPILLIGEEKQIRHFFFELFYLAYGLTEEYQYKPISIVGVEAGKLPFPVLKRMELLRFITKYRVEQHYYLSESATNFVSYEGSIKRDMIVSFIQSTMSEEMTAAEKEREVNFFFSYIVTIDIIGFEEFEDMRIETAYLKNKHVEIIRIWIEKLMFFFKIELSAKIHFFLNLNLYHHFIREELLTGSMSRNIKKVGEATNENILDETVRFFLESIQSEFSDSLINEDFYSLLIKEVLMNSRKKVEICVFSGVAHAHKKHIENQIKRFSIVPVEFDSVVTNDTKLVVSDYYFKEAKKSDVKKIDRLFIKTFPSFEEYLLVSKKIFSIYRRL